MNGQRQDGGAVALYWDFENLHAGLADARYGEGFYARADARFKPQEPLVDVQAVVDLCAAYGPIAINRAYCNWQFYGRYRDALLQHGVELVQLFPPGASAKNGADIQLCLDAFEDAMRFDHIGTVAVIGGDSDFMPLARKIKAAGKTLLGIGTRRNTNRHWARSCHAFRYYDSLEGAAAAPDAPGEAAAADLLRRAVRLAAQAQDDGESGGNAWVERAAVWRMLRRLDATFDAREHGFAGFAGLLESVPGLVELREGAAGPELRLVR